MDVVAKGIDIFDCVAPTRNARHGSLYCGKIVEKDAWLRFESDYEKGHILIKKAIYARDETPIMEDCSCYTCKHYSRAYLHFLFKAQALIYSNLACIHNIHVMNDICKKMQVFINNC